MRLWIWQVHIKNALTHLSHIISHYFYWKKVGSENFSHPYAMFQFINTGRSDLISFLPFDNYIQHLWFSCFSLQAPFTLIVRSVLHSWVFFDKWDFCVICNMELFAEQISRLHTTSSSILQQSVNNSLLCQTSYPYPLQYGTFGYSILRTSCYISQYFLTNDGLVFNEMDIFQQTILNGIHPSFDPYHLDKGNDSSCFVLKVILLKWKCHCVYRH